MIRFLNVFGLAVFIIRPFCLGVDLRRPLFWFVFKLKQRTEDYP